MAGLAGEGDMQSFVDEFGLPFPQTVSDDGRLWSRFGVLGQAEWLFVTRDGSSTLVPHDLTGDELSAQLDELFGAQPEPRTA